jgi:hypothetical protein
MPQYVLLIHGPAEGGPSPEQREAEMPRWFEYTDALRAAGAMVAGEALMPAAAARTVRLRSGVRHIIEGPVADTAEVLGGFYVIDVADWAEAEAWAARIPSAPYGSVEIRPVLELPDAKPAAAGRAAQTA